ncbi:MAG: hypothetical protein WA715_18190 [Candidatus Acidiferrum sp.]
MNCPLRSVASGALKWGICYPPKTMVLRQKFMQWVVFTLIVMCFGLCSVVDLTAQQVASAPGTAKQGAAAGAAVAGSTNAEFAAAADEVLEQMSEITGLKLLTPLKKSLKSREQIRAYVVNEMKEDKDEAERYAGQRSAEAFGLLPKGFDLDSFMIDLLTEQIAGLYDPKTHEFYVADWIPATDQKMVMAHELTHALQDQHFQIDSWVKAARPNDDAELARESVLEGSAMAAMVDYLLAGTGRSLQDLPDIDPSMLVGDMESTPMLKKAPAFLKDALVFPYLDGLNFSAAVVRPNGWGALAGVFAKPPVSTQQIMHPALYASFRTPPQAELPVGVMEKELGADWTKLEDNLMGEFGWKEVLKQFLGEERATPLAAGWSTDRYLVFEQKKTKKLVLVTRLDLADERATSRFFAAYAEALGKKYEKRTEEKRDGDFFSFESADGGVFFRCAETSCVSLEGVGKAVFEKLNKGLNWDVAPGKDAEKTSVTQRRETGARVRRSSLVQ